MKGKFSFRSVEISWLLVLGSLLISTKTAPASIHDYKKRFTPQSNAAFFNGGSEGLYSSSHAIGDAYSKSSAICCTPKLAQDRTCIVGEVILQKNRDIPEWPIRIQTFFAGTILEVKMIANHMRNPGGYLPGKMVPLMTFYGISSFSLSCSWHYVGLQIVKFWKDIVQLHYHITVVISLGMCEMSLWSMAITLWSLNVTAAKKTLISPAPFGCFNGIWCDGTNLGGVTLKVSLLGIMYFIASEALELIEHLGNINDFSGKTKLYMAKLQLYRKFTNSLEIFVLLSIAWLYFNASDPLNELWRIAWILLALWIVLAFSLLAEILDVRTAHDLDEDALPLTSGVKVVLTWEPKGKEGGLLQQMIV
ncbi:hypothetical protein Pfo_030010 [Paulownia fortunei]|nr:hypothetical protein Pfo_030010 [Paulownia fortunei]